MNDIELARRLDEQAARLEQIYVSVEKTRKYFLTTLIITVVMVVLPLLGLFFVVPQLFDAYMTTSSDLDGLLN